jgi:hypothetical protein
MRLLLIALSLPLMAGATETPKSMPARTAKAVCQPGGVTQAQDGVLRDTRKAQARRLGDLPPAKQQLAVIRTLDGCSVPTVVRENIGG